MYPIRGDIHVAIDYKRDDPENMTIREMVEYYKKVVRVAQTLGTPTQMEVNHVDKAWDHLVGVVAKREGVPAGWLTYMAGELARTEMRAAEEAERALEASMQDL